MMKLKGRDNPFYATIASGRYTIWRVGVYNCLKEDLSPDEAVDFIKAETKKLEQEQNNTYGDG